MSKYDLVQAMLDDIPDDLKAMLGVSFGAFDTLTMPDTEEDAIIAMGRMSVEVQNKLLVPLSGFPLAAAVLYIGALNPSVIAGLFAGLEAISGAAFDVIAPKNGGVYPGYFEDWTIRAPDAESLSVTVDPGTENEDTFDLTQNDGTWTKKWPVAIGAHTASITDGAASMSVSFSVVSWDVYPPEGETVPPGDIQVTINPGEGATFDSVHTIVNGEAVEMVEENGTWTGTLLNALEGYFKTVYKVSLSDEIVEFVVEWVCENV